MGGKIWHEEKKRTTRRAPGDNVLLDQFQTVAAILTSDWAEKLLSRSFWLLIGARKLFCFSAQSEGRKAATIWNWSGKRMAPGALLAVLYFSLCHVLPPV